MINITLPDGSIKAFSSGVTPMDVARSISEGLARNVISASFNGTTVETETTLTTDGALVLYTWNDQEGKKAFWHSTSHVMAQALQEIYPGIKLTLGPAIDNGFYYDVDFMEHKITDAEFKKIEDRVLEIAREKHEFKMRSVSKSEALAIYKDNEYKTELISNLEDGTITFCDHSNFFDLCRGGHIPNTGLIKAMKIMSVAGAYWRGDEKNKQLTRVYGISFPKQKELTEYLELLEEAKDNFMFNQLEQGGSIHLHLEAEIHEISADPVHITNVVYNLLDNAIKYCSVTPEISIQTRNLKNGIQLEFADNGIGMKREDLKMIFDKFYRVPTGNLHDVKGFGLGLFYVKLIIDEHKGKIDVKSTLGKGTTFTIWLPFQF